MALISNFTKYETDGGKEAIVKINYDEDTNAERLEKGKFDAPNIITNGCKSITPRRLLFPRYIETSDLGLIYFRTHQDWLDYIDNNKETVKKAQGEKLSCTAINLLY